MKTKMLAACMLAAITLSLLSCDWFSKKDSSETPSVIGTWQLTGVKDSARNEKDISNLMLFAMKPDSAKVLVTFGSDSTAIFSFANKGEPDSSKFYVDSSVQKIFIKEDSVFHTYGIISLTKDSLELADDSLHLVFKKQP